MARKVVKVVDKPAPKTAAKKNKKLPETEVWKLRSKRSELKNMLARMTFQRTRNRALTSLLQDPLMPQIETIALAADSRKAALINALRVQEWTEIADFMIVIEGNNKPQNMAIAGAIEEAMEKQHGWMPTSKEGVAASGWTLLDYGSIIVHIMTAPMRKYYRLEKRWGMAEQVDLTHLLMANEAHQTPRLPEQQQQEEQVKDEMDPFWS